MRFWNWGRAAETPGQAPLPQPGEAVQVQAPRTATAPCTARGSAPSACAAFSWTPPSRSPCRPARP